jgi:hypothetical protein
MIRMGWKFFDHLLSCTNQTWLTDEPWTPPIRTVIYWGERSDSKSLRKASSSLKDYVLVTMEPSRAGQKAQHFRWESTSHKYLNCVSSVGSTSNAWNSWFLIRGGASGGWRWPDDSRTSAGAKGPVNGHGSAGSRTSVSETSAEGEILWLCEGASNIVCSTNSSLISETERAGGPYQTQGQGTPGG